jgi:hypothetical protein
MLARLAKLCFSKASFRVLAVLGAAGAIFDCCCFKIQILTVVMIQQMIVIAKRMMVWLFLFTGKFQTGLGSTAEQMYQKMLFLPGSARNAIYGYKNDIKA